MCVFGGGWGGVYAKIWDFVDSGPIWEGNHDLLLKVMLLRIRGKLKLMKMIGGYIIKAWVSKGIKNNGTKNLDAFELYLIDETISEPINISELGCTVQIYLQPKIILRKC